MFTQANPRRLASEAETKLLMTHLDRLEGGDIRILSLLPPTEGKYRRTGDFLLSASRELMTRFNWCASFNDASSNDVSFDDESLDTESEWQTECLQDHFEDVILQAARDHQIDVIEEAHLISYLPTLVWVNGAIHVDSSQFTPLTRGSRSLKEKEAPLPDFQMHLSLKRSMAAVRIQRGQTQAFDDQFLRLLRKTYRRRIAGIGRVDAIHYVLAKYNRIQINTLSSAMMNTIRLMNAKKAVMSFETEQGTVTIPFHQDWIADMALCLLKYDLKSKIDREPSSLLRSMNPTLDDAMIASLITGEISTEWATAIMSQPEFIEKHEDWKKGLKLLSDVARTLLITQPQIIPFFTFGTILVQSIQKKKEYENEAAHDSDLFDCR